MRILSLLLFFFSLNLAAQQELSKEEVAQFQEKMMAKANELETLQANFIQTKSMEMIADETVSRGKIYYQNPGKLKWKYTEPQDYIILFIEGKLHINDAGDKSVRNTASSKLFGKIANLIIGSVNGKLLQDNENFDISYFKENDNIIAVIIPKDEHLSQMFSEIQMQFNAEKVVEKVSLMEESGDATVIEFSEIQWNKDIPSSVFQP
ncbi:outer membrane lipoprotein carrier protein LolA [Salegentibacter mishustinae]|uniref:LolA family protein n=1 Tax=Salegentibacter mishustinae TaxID=270918 RepID=UPI001CE1F982|nr:outer membrane lipoprotein carrier protein LolA [Salegentibacter mishustinae]UBZ06518.1 outer membrane lipoprotein carrier protein LolA [Salegentibacter mishustinae]